MSENVRFNFSQFSDSNDFEEDFDCDEFSTDGSSTEEQSSEIEFDKYEFKAN